MSPQWYQWLMEHYRIVVENVLCSLSPSCTFWWCFCLGLGSHRDAVLVPKSCCAQHEVFLDLFVHVGGTFRGWRYKSNMKVRWCSETWFHALGTFHFLSYKTGGFCLPAWQDAGISWTPDVHPPYWAHKELPPVQTQGLAVNTQKPELSKLLYFRLVCWDFLPIKSSARKKRPCIKWRIFQCSSSVYGDRSLVF